MHGQNDKRGVKVSLDQVRPRLFCVHCEWTKPTTPITITENPPLGIESVPGKRNAILSIPSRFEIDDGSSRSNKSTSNKTPVSSSFGTPTVFGMTSSNKTSVSSLWGTPAFVNPSLGSSFKQSQMQQLQPHSLSEAPTVLPASFSFATPAQTLPSSVFNFGTEWNMSQQQQTSCSGDKPQANSCLSSSGATTDQPSHVQESQDLSPSVNTSRGTSNNTCQQPDAKKETIKYVAKFTINQQPYSFQASFDTSTSNVTVSLALTQIGTNPRLFTEVDNMSDEPIPGNKTVEKDDVQLPSAVWVNLEGSGKKNHILKFSDPDNCWVSNNFNSDFARFTSSSGSSFIAWRLLSCSVWIEFETSSLGERKTLKHLTDLYVEQRYCDVRFSFKGDQHTGGHRNILAARSPVFAAMFQYNMKEAITGQVNIDDSEPNIFKQLLHYIYSGRISTPLTDSIAQPLFLVADKYNIQDLKEECAEFLLTCVRMDNVVGLLVWAHLHSIDALKEVTLTFVANNAKSICHLKDWEELTKNYPDLCILATRRIIGCKPQQV